VISLPEFKIALGSLADRLTDAEIERARIVCDQFADAVFDKWTKTVNSKMPLPKNDKSVLSK
jgi:hypothetical protein